MSTDMWTDDFRKIHYLSITCHYVTENFELIGKNLTTATFPVDEKKMAITSRGSWSSSWSPSSDSTHCL